MLANLLSEAKKSSNKEGKLIKDQTAKEMFQL